MRLSLLINVLLSLQTAVSVLQWKDREALLDLHNHYRKLILHGKVYNQPSADRMNILSWDDNLARNAENWASKCEIGHDDDQDRRTMEFRFVGQNWAGVKNYTDAVRLWFEEHNYYNYWTNECRRGKVCGHYTQLIWANTLKVGCGIKKCRKSRMPFGYSVVCNYGPAGNFFGEFPYETSEEAHGFNRS
ncbi:hypothetical protein P879_04893 [Paragonimus westermani]|uniref:SCP domain-containing protein n=1 Tax=Paragonimus westermani TaxID=34504 RepID=A0A8T0DJZ1_9TREM|nr:hypothetical protein P879_04893 [Paragonimus westermani]